MAGRLKRDATTGRLIRSGGVLHKCTCCCSTYYKATLCNSGDCLGWVYEVYICSNTECEGDPLTNGQVIGGTVGGQTYCFTVDTTVLFCGEETDDCVPLPPGAEILPPGKWGCLEDCGPVNCPPIDGYYVAVPCSCNDGDPPGTVYVSCTAYLDSLGDFECPTWSVVISGTAYCMYVREGSPATELPDPLGPDDVVINTTATLGNCCQCCGPREGCCWVEYENFTRTWNPDCSVTQVDGPYSYCCGTTESWRVSASGSILTEQHIGGGTVCPVNLTEWDFSDLEPGDTFVVTVTTYTGDCSGITDVSTSNVTLPSGCPTGTYGVFPIFIGACAGGGTTQSGSIVQTCSSGTMNVVVDDLPSGNRSTYIGQYTVTSSPGDCGEQTCEALVDFDAPAALVGSGSFR